MVNIEDKHKDTYSKLRRAAVVQVVVVVVVVVVRLLR